MEANGLELMAKFSNKTNAARHAEGLTSKNRFRKKSLSPLHEILTRVLATTEGAPKRRRSSKSLKVFDAFKALGPPFTQNAEPKFFRKGVLTLTVEQSAWLTELTFLAPDIISRLNQALGAELITEIRAQQGQFESAALSKPKPKPKRPPALPPAVSPYAEEQLAELGQNIKNTELRQAIQRAARWSYGKGY